ncbi:MerR family DNA-binding protein [Rhodococcus sp. NPDC049939]|uniref:MerR family DNA-binding protein n=1 Tax=Rhodococcus sp. NPDC049939 TaxID=3155511 RepID=UPI0034048B47
MDGQTGAFIQAAKQVGLSLDEIRELLVVWEHLPCAEVRATLRPLIATRLSEVTARVADLATFSRFLRDSLSQLDDPHPARTNAMGAARASVVRPIGGSKHGDCYVAGLSRPPAPLDGGDLEARAGAWVRTQMRS